jgi:HSP20 family protein
MTVVSDGAPYLEQHVEDRSLVVRLYLPGIDPETEAEVSIADDILTISAGPTRNPGSDAVAAPSTHRLRLPQGCPAGLVAATYQAGVLQVVLPLGEAYGPYRIPVRRVDG